MHAGGKQELMDALVEQQVRQWQATEYEKGQRATDYTTWLTSQTHYSIKFEEVSSRQCCCFVQPICLRIYSCCEDASTPLCAVYKMADYCTSPGQLIADVHSHIARQIAKCATVTTMLSSSMTEHVCMTLNCKLKSCPWVEVKVCTSRYCLPMQWMETWLSHMHKL